MMRFIILLLFLSTELASQTNFSFDFYIRPSFIDSKSEVSKSSILPFENQSKFYNNIGIRVKKEFSQRSAFFAGFNLSQVSLTSNCYWKTTGGHDAGLVKDCNFSYVERHNLLDIGLFYSYSIVKKKKISLYSFLGFSSIFLIGGTGEVQSDVEYFNNVLNKYVKVFNPQLGLGFNYSLMEYIKFFVEPVFIYELYSKRKTYGLNLGTSYLL